MFSWLSRFFLKSNSSEIKENRQRNRCAIKIPPVQTVKKDIEMSRREHLGLKPQRQNGEKRLIKNSADRCGNKPDSSFHSHTESNTVQNQEMKSSQQLNEQSSYDRKDKRLFVTDRHSGMKFLINTGCRHSLYPLSLTPKRVTQIPEEFLLVQSTDSLMQEYGTTNMTLDLGLERDFYCDLIISDVSQPTLGADFLTHFGIDVNLKKKLISLDHDSDLSINSRLPSNIVSNQNQDEEQNEEDSNDDDSRVFVTDQNSGIRFLVDGGAQASIYPRSKLKDRNLTRDPNCNLHQADNTKISTYGTILLNLNFGLNRNIIGKFRVADVKQPIIGADFMKDNKLFANHINNSLNNLSIWHAHKQKYDQFYEYFYQVVVISLEFITFSIVIFSIGLYLYCDYTLAYWFTINECTAVCRFNIFTKRYDELIKFLLK